MKSQLAVMILALSAAVILPLSLSFWILSLIGSGSNHDATLPSPIRWFLSIFVPILVVAWGLNKKSLDRSGAVLALAVGFIMTLSNYCFMVGMLTFFITSSKVTKYRAQQKKKIETDFKQGGQRNWIQVLCNGGVASELALLFLIERGSGGEIPINFALDYNPSWFAVAVLGALACCNGDTWASELGMVMSRSDPFLITSFKRVPRGTNGAVSFIGLLVSLVGGLVIGFSFYVAMLIFAPRDVLAMAPPQWPVIVVGGLAGLLGSILDSIMGATLQYSGQDQVTGKIVEQPNDRARYISGVALLDNHSVNLLSVLITALLTPQVAMWVWTFADPVSVPFGS